MDNLHVKQTGDKIFTVYTSETGVNYNDMQETMEFINEIVIWCKKAYNNEYETWDFRSNGCIFTFEKEEDAVAFKLRWT